MTEEKNNPSFVSSLFSGPYLHLSIVILLSSLLLFSNLHSGGLTGYDDALYAHEGHQMLASGNWWSVQCNGVFNFEYPPMFFWMEALSMAVWGITDFAAKFPSALSGLLTIIAVFLIGRRLNRNFFFPISAAWILMLSQYFMKYSMHAMTDVPYTLFFTLAILFYVSGEEKPGFYIPCGAAIACAILIRSALGLIPLIIIIVHPLYIRRFRLFRSPRFLLGLFLAAALPSIWYVSQYSIHGKIFLSSHFSVISDKLKSDGQTGILDYVWRATEYARLLLKLYWPWLPFMLLGFWRMVKIALRSRDRAASLLVIWPLCVVCILSLVEAKILRYIMPVFPVFALLAAEPISAWLIRIRNRSFLRTGYMLLCLAVVVIPFFSRPYPRAGEIRTIGAAVQAQTAMSDRVVIFSSGKNLDDFRNQFLWYSGRFCDYQVYRPEFMDLLMSGEKRFFLVDRMSFENLVVPSGVKITRLLDTQNWILFKKLHE